MSLGRSIAFKAFVASNIAIAIFAFCLAFMLGPGGAGGSFITFLATWLLAGVFICYGLLLGFFLACGTPPFQIRFALFAAGIGLATCVIRECFGVRSNASAIAAIFSAIVIAAHLELSVIQVVLGFRITWREHASQPPFSGQYGIRTVAYWTVGTAALLSLIRLSEVGFSSLLVLGMIAVTTNIIVLLVLDAVLGSGRRAAMFFLAIGATLFLSALEAIAWGRLDRSMPLWYWAAVVTSANVGVLLTVTYVGLGLKLQGFRLIRNPIRIGRLRTSEKRSKHPNTVDIFHESTSP